MHSKKLWKKKKMTEDMQNCKILNFLCFKSKTVPIMLKKVLQKETKNSNNFCLSQMQGEVTCNKCKTKLKLV